MVGSSTSRLDSDPGEWGLETIALALHERSH
jgi:hypothetical protein